MSTSEQPIGLARNSRRNFLRRSAVLAGGATAGTMALGLLKPTGVKAAAPSDLGGFSDYAADFEQIRGHENDHVSFLIEALGSDARPKPTFVNLAQGSAAATVKVSQMLENVGSGAYLGAAPYIDDPDYLAAAGSIALIEGRHAGFLNVLSKDFITDDAVGRTPFDNSFETALTAEEVRTLAGGLITNLNGGPAVDYSTTPSPSNDIAILNFALALEYLEAEFYNVNVPKFFGPGGRGRFPRSR